jgi:hypothetical protein
MALLETKPAFRSSRIVGPKASARTSAACLVANPVLILLLPEVIEPSRVSILTTVVRCQLPPRTVGIPLRFNSSASARRVTKPAAISFRMVEAKARARESAARLFVEATCRRPRICPMSLPALQSSFRSGRTQPHTNEGPPRHLSRTGLGPADTSTVRSTGAKRGQQISSGTTSHSRLRGV